jgi:carbamoyltransferase
VIPWEPRSTDRFVTELRTAITAPTLYNAYRLKESAEYAVIGTAQIERRLADIGTPVPPISTRRHHDCHAASAFYPAGFSEAVVLTIDGRGEFDSTVVWRGDDAGLRRVRTYRFPNSWGIFYGAITEYLGYRALNDEGKVMGLAPYGTDNPDIEARLRSEIDTGIDYDLTPLTSAGDISDIVSRLEELFDRPRKRRPTDFTQWEKDLAFTAQQLLERTVTRIVERYCRELGISNVALAGGVALNCKMNKSIMESPAVDEMFIQPVANDAGTALGAGMDAATASSNPEPFSIYLGPEYPVQRIRTVLETNKIPYFEPDDVARYTAEKIADGELVGWFQGRLEIGPRALGNRSILADPRTDASRDRVNKFVKHRETWRPFAPSMLEDAISEYVENAEPAPYMIRTFDVKDERAEELTAVLHPGDGTTRPQTVTPDRNPRYHRLLTEFEELTGVPVVLNTSFNDHGEPIVNNPSEAIKDFFGMGLDVLVLESVVVEK